MDGARPGAASGATVSGRRTARPPWTRGQGQAPTGCSPPASEAQPLLLLAVSVGTSRHAAGSTDPGPLRRRRKGHLCRSRWVVAGGRAAGSLAVPSGRRLRVPDLGCGGPCEVRTCASRHRRVRRDMLRSGNDESIRITESARYVRTTRGLSGRTYLASRRWEPDLPAPITRNGHSRSVERLSRPPNQVDSFFCCGWVKELWAWAKRRLWRSPF